MFLIELWPIDRPSLASYHIVLAPCFVVFSCLNLGNTSGQSRRQIHTGQGLGRHNCCYAMEIPCEMVIANPCWSCGDYHLRYQVDVVPCWQEALECLVGHNRLGGR